MNIAATASLVHPLPAQHAPEGTEGAGPDRDGDSDNAASAAGQSKPVATPPAGMGATVDKTA